MTEKKARELIAALIPVADKLKSICQQFGVEGEVPSIAVDMKSNYVMFNDSNGVFMSRSSLHPEEWLVDSPDVHTQSIVMGGETDEAEA